MLAVSAGRLVFGYMDSNGGKAMRNMRWLTLTVGGLTLICVVATFVSSRTVARASRRMVLYHEYPIISGSDSNSC